MEPYLREWRQDALNKAQYESAIFVGDKLLALTGADEDAFWLAQVHFAMGNYTRAHALLSKSDLIERNASCRYLSAHCLVKQNQFDEALGVLGEHNPKHLIPSLGNKRRPAAAAAAAAAEAAAAAAAAAATASSATASIPSTAAARAAKTGTTTNTNSSTSTAGGTLGQYGGGKGAAGPKGHGPSRSIGMSVRGAHASTAHRKDKEASASAGAAAAAAAAQAALEAAMAAEAAADAEASTRRYEAGMCYLRGICFARQNVFDRAKECYKDAVRIDVQCFEAFQQLTKNQLMAPDEEWEFVESLDFGSVHLGAGAPSGARARDDAVQEAADFTRMLYSTRLNKYRNPEMFSAAAETLATHYRLGRNADLLLACADLAYTQCRYEEALGLTRRVLEEDRYNFGAYPLHLACLFELRMQNALFLVSHDLADHHPEEPCTWLAVGVYYFATGRIAEARRYFSKASMMDTHFGPAWIGFAHTFAAEGEHDQAISAYSTAARLFTGTHLPQVFLGMQHHAMNNLVVAEEFLKMAYSMCREDPLLLNEMGVVMYHQGRLQDAATLFGQALGLAEDMGCDRLAWMGARTNLGHALRRMRLFREAQAQFAEVLRVGGKDASIFCAQGMMQLERGRPAAAAEVLQRALAIRPQDIVATELMNRALEEMAAGMSIGREKKKGDEGDKEEDDDEDDEEYEDEDEDEDDKDDEDDDDDEEEDDDDDDDDAAAAFEEALLADRQAARAQLDRTEPRKRVKDKGKGRATDEDTAMGDDTIMRYFGFH